jgi:fructokinase
MQQPGLLAGIRAEVRARLRGYVPAPALTDGIESYIVRPALGNEAGVLGAIAMAEELVANQ